MHLDELDADAFRLLKRYGLSDAQIARPHRLPDELPPCARAAKMLHVVPAFKTVDTCAAEFPSQHAPTTTRPTTRARRRWRRKTRRRAMILGAGPNRIGQGIEFDYCCVHASYALARGRASRPSW